MDNTIILLITYSVIVTFILIAIFIAYKRKNKEITNLIIKQKSEKEESQEKDTELKRTTKDDENNSLSELSTGQQTEAFQKSRKSRIYYFNIESDSKKLNIDTNPEERETLIENVLKELEDEIASGEYKDNIVELEIPEEPNARNDSKDYLHGDKRSRLDHEQEYVIKKLLGTRDNFFITGKAGTGKSFLLDVFSAATKKKVLKLAPTGIAALNIGGVTIHSAFGFYNLEELAVEDINSNTIRLKSEKRLLLKETDVIVIDEISMVRADTFNKIDLILQHVCKNERPFGGKQLLLFGDIFQLPPVTMRSEERYLKDKYGGVYFFNSASYKTNGFNFVELTINHRQESDELFFDILNRVREGKETDEDIIALNQRVISDTQEPQQIMTVFPMKDEADKHNKDALDKLDSTGRTYDAKVVYDRNPEYTRNIDNSFPITAKLELKVGAIIMMVVNDPNKRWVNGTLGIVKALEDDKIIVVINGEQYEVKPVEFTQREAVYENGRISYIETFAVEQFPVVLAYAITIHKSQGKTYQQIACDVKKCFAPGQAYVALSRCTSMEGLHLLSPVSKSMITVETEVIDFYNEQTNCCKEKEEVLLENNNV